ncbi:MAG TPA: hypothetical protein VJA47_02715 [archaeon]|nr:hypothetical protein [archaeon]
MIKKNTKIILQDNKNQSTEELVGGIPLSKGEIVHVHQNTNKVVDYEVVDKNIDCFLNGKDQKVNITYTLKKK